MLLPACSSKTSAANIPSRRLASESPVWWLQIWWFISIAFGSPDAVTAPFRPRTYRQCNRMGHVLTHRCLVFATAGGLVLVTRTSLGDERPFLEAAPSEAKQLRAEQIFHNAATHSGWLKDWRQKVSSERLTSCNVAGFSLRKVHQKYLETFEVWCWRRMEKISQHTV
jgi:hypothetical protein